MPLPRYALIFAVALAGCSDPHKGKVAVSGKITLKGAPLNNGIVMFEPLDNQGTGGSAMLANGEYSIPKANGLKAGKYLVRVTAGDGKTQESTGEPGPGGSTNIVSKDLVPPEWNQRSKQEVTVKGDDTNTLDFNIP